MHGAWHVPIIAFVSLQLAACSGNDPMEAAPLPMETAPLPLDLARPPAPAEGSVCASDPEGVATIERPMFPDREGSPSFGFSFRVFPGTDPDATTVIHLPGGPGQTGIDVMRDEAYAPLSHTLIATDLRGVGCNAPETADHYPAEFYRSVHFADDVIAMIEDLALDDYVLYGISYGTMLATIVASRIEARGLPPPRGLVLEGVLGEAFTADKPGDEVAFQEQWREIRDSLDENIRSQLAMEPLPLGLSNEQWGAGLAGMLPLASSPLTGDLNFVYAILQGLAPGGTEDQRAAIFNLIQTLGASPVDAMGERLHHEVTCREIAEDDYVSLALEGGELVATRFDCVDIALSEPFSAADWPVHVPLYYFSGTDDTNTPPWQARFHFESQVAAPRQLVHITDGGHNARLLNLSDCADSLWQAMTTASGFEAALATCSWPTELESAAAR